VEVQRPRATAPPAYQLLLPLELPEALEPPARPPARPPAQAFSSPPTVRPCQVWGALPLTERIRVQRVFVQVIQEVLGNGNRYSRP
jgi:hypothetical protein